MLLWSPTSHITSTGNIYLIICIYCVILCCYHMCKAGLQANTNFETDATITHVEAIKVWVEVSGGLHLDLASELYYRWPKECPPQDLVKLTEETGIQVGMP